MPRGTRRSRASGSAPAQRPERALVLAVSGLVVLAPQLLGAQAGWAISTLALYSGGCAISAAVVLREKLARVPQSPIMYAAAAALVWTGVQAVPVPAELVALFQPEVHALVHEADALLGREPRGWMTFSYSPHATRTELLKLSVVLMSLTLAWTLASLGWRRAMIRAVGLSAAVMAFVALAHLAADADSVFGAYTPRRASPVLLAPLMNRNHLSGFVAMGVPILVGLGLDRDHGRFRYAWLSAGVLTGMTALLAASRGGVASLVLGVAMLGVLGLVKHRGPKAARSRFQWWALAGAVAALAGYGTFAAWDRLVMDFEGGGLDKLELAAGGLGLALDHPWTGVGRGAFSAAFVAEHGRAYRFTHPENLFAQWASEWGIPVALGIAVVVTRALWRAARRARSWTRRGALAGLMSIVAHEMVDFSTELLGVAAVVAALLGASLVSGKRSRPTRWNARASLVSLSALTLTLSLTYGWRLDGESVAALENRLGNQMQMRRREEFRSTLARAIRIHPAEPSFYLLAGAEAAAHADPRALRWLNHSMMRATQWSSPHVVTARYLATRGHFAQAFAELRRAEELAAGSGHALACELILREPEATADLVRSAKGDAIGTSFINRVAMCLPPDAASTRRLDDHLRASGVRGAFVREARRALDEEAPERALTLLRGVEDDAQHSASYLRAQAHLTLGDPALAAQHLQSPIDEAPRPERLLRLQARAFAEAGDMAGVEAACGRLRGLATGRAERIAEVWVLQGDLARAMRNHGAAMQAYERANRLAPHSLGLERVAALSAELGDLGRAFRAYSDLCRVADETTSHCQAASDIRGRLAEPPAGPAQRSTTPP